MGDLRCQFRGLVKILQIRAALRTTIRSYRELQIAKVDDEDEVDDLHRETDVSWMYEEPAVDFDWSEIVASSPIEPVISPCGSDMDDDQDDNA
ncbi:hypothetical protein DFQ26_000170 [Actinomortierella ambigua]|nr:hypothetical protein DFQ26_000170 [Actinomortierella ambigua]